jgi:hypothetical protein
VRLPIIDNHYDGIGDAVTYCWIAHSARAAGINVRLNIRRHQEIAWIFGQEANLTVAPGDRWFSDRGDGSDHWKHEIGEAGHGAVKTRFEAWCEGLGLGAFPPVRPPYVEHTHLAAWADRLWSDRDMQAGSLDRILIFPECAWTARTWPRAYWIDLAWMLHNQGHNTIVALPQKTDEFPFAIWGHSLPHIASLCARADLVIANDSGPAHIAGTLDRPTLAVCGPTRPEIVFDHLPSVRGITAPRYMVGCVGCHFRGPFRRACGSGCQALYRLTPERVFVEVEHELANPRQCESRGAGGTAAGAPANRGGGECNAVAACGPAGGGI